MMEFTKKRGIGTFYNTSNSCTYKISCFKDKDINVGTMYIGQFKVDNEYYLFRTWVEFVDILKELSVKYKTTLKHNMYIYVDKLAELYIFTRKILSINSMKYRKNKVFELITDYGIIFRCISSTTGENYSLPFTEKIYTSESDITSDDIKELTTINDKICDVVDIMIKENEYITRVNFSYVGDVVKEMSTTLLYNKSDKGTITNECKEYANTMKSLIIPNLECYKDLRNSIKGAFVGYNKNDINTTIDNVCSYDFNSSYLATMVCEEFPLSEFELVDLQTISDNELHKHIKYSACIINVTFINISSKLLVENYIHKEQVLHSNQADYNDTNTLIHAKAINITVNDVDFKEICKYYSIEEIHINKMWIARKSYLPKVLIKYIIDAYDKKTQLKGVKDKEREYAKNKCKANMIYGLSIVDALRDNEYNEHLTEEERINAYNDRKKYLWYPWGIYVCSYAKRNLFSGISALGNDFKYCDTDCVKFTNYDKHKEYFDNYNSDIENKLKIRCKVYKIDYNLVNPTTIKGEHKLLGAWDYEGCGKLKYVGRKCYIENIKGYTQAVITGISKVKVREYLNSTNKDWFEMFNKSFEIPKEYSGTYNAVVYYDSVMGTIKDNNNKIVNYNENEYVYKTYTNFTVGGLDTFLINKGVERYG